MPVAIDWCYSDKGYYQSNMRCFTNLVTEANDVNVNCKENLRSKKVEAGGGGGDAQKKKRKK